MEKQKADNSIDFLDTTVYNMGSKFKTKWYYKAIASNRILNHFSKHPTKMIMNVAKAFIRRALQVSHKSFQKEIIFDVHRILAKNNFPEPTIKKLIHQVINSPARNQQNSQKSYPFLQSTLADVQTNDPIVNSTMIDNQTVDVQPNIVEKKLTYPKKALGFAGLTYIPGISESLEKHFIENAPNLRLAPKPPDKLNRVFSDMKQKLRPDQHSNAIYLIPCKMCGKCYIGETSWSVCERCAQHKKDIRYIAKKPNKTALVAHVNAQKHEFDFDGVRVLKKVRAKGLLKIHEANQIILHEDVVVNFKKDAKHVSPVFYN